MARWIGVDLDGTLATITGISGNKIGEPVRPMVNQVKRWLANGREVRILTARKLSSSQTLEIERWLKRNGIEKCGITNSKDPGIAELWDDNAIRVERNTGKLCPGCRASRNHSAAPDASTLILTDC